MKVFGLIFVIAVSAPIAQQAYALSGEELFERCSGKRDNVKVAQCENYITGVVDGMSTLATSMNILHPENGSYPKLFCPEKASLGDIVQATKSYLAKNSDARHFNAASEVMLALKQAFPCDK